MGFLFACGAKGAERYEARDHHTDGLRHVGRKMGVVMPEDDSEVTYADDIREFLIVEGATGGVVMVGTA